MKDITTVSRVVSLGARAFLFMIIIAIILIWGYTKAGYRLSTLLEFRRKIKKFPKKIQK